MASAHSSDKRAFFEKETTIISKNIFIQGKLFCKDNLHIDGKVEGEIFCEGVVSIGKSAQVKGCVEASLVLVSGLVCGFLKAQELEVFNGGVVEGRWEVSHLEVEEGAKLLLGSKKSDCPFSDKIATNHKPYSHQKS